MVWGRRRGAASHRPGGGWQDTGTFSRMRRIEIFFVGWGLVFEFEWRWFLRASDGSSGLRSRRLLTTCHLGRLFSWSLVIGNALQGFGVNILLEGSAVRMK